MAGRTLRFLVEPANLERSRDAIGRAADILRAGGTVAFPTETVYGLGAHAMDEAAVSKIFNAKKRPAWDPLIVHLAEVAMLGEVVSEVPEAARLWIERFWPGPLTLLLPRVRSVPEAVTAGRLRVGVRVPQHPVAQELLRTARIPVAAPSANLFGHVSPTTAAHVLADLDGRIDALLDSGPCEHGLESTVVDPCVDPCIVYRPGAVTLEQLAAVWPRVTLHREPMMTARVERPEALPSPGVGLRHYAPHARLLLIEHGVEQASEFKRTIINAQQDGRTGVLLPDGFLAEKEEVLFQDMHVFAWGKWSNPETLAHRLFEGLRSLDASGAARIVCPLPPPYGIGAALCDRLRKAARPR